MKILNKINNVEDLKKLDESDLPRLCKEIRSFLVKSVSKTGGHLASNLGVVELVVAMHYVFDSPTDKFIFDVGHQSYVHKILTGRKNEFGNLRKYNGLSGFPKASESEHDAFDTGHSTTSISAGVGYAIGRDLKGEKNKVISVIGDGSFTGGMAYEALNNAGKSKTDLIVVLNDNNMSISENVGALAVNLNKLRMSEAYNDAKTGTKNTLEKFFDENNLVGSAISVTKGKLRRAVYNDGFFESLGFRYYGKIDGNNVLELIKTFRFIKEMRAPILLHIDTKKGLGYKFSEENPEGFHGISKFDVVTGNTNKGNGQSYSSVFGDKLCDLAEKHKNIVAITAAMSAGTGLKKFQDTYPKRFFDVGIAEQHAVTFASAISKEGFIPFIAIYSTFLQRAYDQIIHDVAIMEQKVVFCIDRAGLVGEDGETHQGVFDIGYLLNIPGMTIMSPYNKQELEEMLELAYEIKGPVAVRYPRGNVPNVDYDVSRVEAFKCQKILEPDVKSDIAIVAVGNMVDNALKAREILKGQGISVSVINPRFLKPVDESMVKDFENYKFVVSLEDGQKINGFGAYLQNKAVELGVKTEIKNLGYEDRFTNQGSVAELFKEHGVDAESIAEFVKKLNSLK